MASNRGIFRDPREIAILCFFPDDGIARRAAIDGGVGADFDAVLNNDPANPQRLGKPGRGKGNAGMAAIDTGLADACTRMHNNAVADQRMANRDLRPDQAIAADTDIGTNHAVCTDDCTEANFGAWTDDHTRVDDHALFKPCFGMD